jgi:hypothetical protein
MEGLIVVKLEYNFGLYFLTNNQSLSKINRIYIMIKQSFIVLDK